MRSPHLSLIAFRHLPRLIRFRLTLWYTGLTAILLVIFGGGVFYTFTQYQLSVQNYTDLLTSTFKQQVRVEFPPSYLMGQLGRAHNGSSGYYGLQLRDPEAPNKSSYPMAFFDLSSGKPLGTSSTSPVLSTGAAKKGQQTVAKAAAQHDNGHTVVTQSGDWRYITIPLSYAGDRVVGQIAVPMARIQDQVDTLTHILISAAGVLLVLSAAGGWMLAGRALRPVDAITQRAQEITEYDLHQRLDLSQEDELGRLAGAFDDMIGRLDAAFEQQKRFTTDASHELRTPLAVMQAEVDLILSRSRSNAEYRQALESVDEELDRISTLVKDLLTMTRADVDRAALQRRPVALHEMLRDLIERVDIIAAERHITIAVERMDPATITGDATRLRQLFTNLLDNAVAYTDEGGRVVLTLEKTRDGARVRVSDTGIGIAPDHLPHVFDRFYRSDEARAHNPSGTGLGLAIAHSVARVHGGDIGVESAPGAGTAFIVTLPSDNRKRVQRLRRVRPAVLREAADRTIA